MFHVGDIVSVIKLPLQLHSILREWYSRHHYCVFQFAVAGEGVSAASSLHHESEILTQSEGASRLPGSDI